MGSKYKGQIASTNHAYAPSLKGQVKSALPKGAKCCYEIVIDGLSLESVVEASKAALYASAAADGVIAISAGNYGGKLGPYHIHLKDLDKPEGLS